MGMVFLEYFILRMAISGITAALWMPKSIMVQVHFTGKMVIFAIVVSGPKIAEKERGLVFAKMEQKNTMDVGMKMNARNMALSTIPAVSFLVMLGVGKEINGMDMEKNMMKMGL